jgi:hypothetical protein
MYTVLKTNILRFQWRTLLWTSRAVMQRSAANEYKFFGGTDSFFKVDLYKTGVTMKDGVRNEIQSWRLQFSGMWSCAFWWVLHSFPDDTARVFLRNLCKYLPDLMHHIPEESILDISLIYNWIWVNINIFDSAGIYADHWRNVEISCCFSFLSG